MSWCCSLLSRQVKSCCNGMSQLGIVDKDSFPGMGTKQALLPTGNYLTAASLEFQSLVLSNGSFLFLLHFS